MAGFFDNIKNSIKDSIIGSDAKEKQDLYKSLKESNAQFNDKQINLITENFEYIKDLNERRVNSNKIIDETNKEIAAQIKLRNKQKSKTIQMQMDSEIRKQKADLKREEAEQKKIIAEQVKFTTRQTKKGYASSDVSNVLNLAENSDKFKAIEEAHRQQQEQREEEVESKNDLAKTNEKYNKGLKLLGADGMTIVSDNLGKLLSSLGFVGAALFETYTRFNKLSEKLVTFNRSMGLGMSSENLLGSDLYANNPNSGNLESLIKNQNLSFDDFLKSYSSFQAGNVVGSQDLGKQQKDLIEFGETSAKLAKFYGISMETLTNTASNLMYGYGASVKEINKQFESGKSIAMSAGVNVQKFFSNLEQATGMIGEYFIRGGIDGMNELAMVATRLGITTRGVMSSMEKYDTFHSQFELMNRASTLALRNMSENTQKVWALNHQGRQDEAIGVQTISLAKDIRALGGFQDGQINKGGLTALKSMGVNKEEIESINKLLRMQEDLAGKGLTYEMLVGLQKGNEQQEQIIKSYERQNQTSGEKMDTAWNSIKTSLLDPLGVVFAPIFDLAMNGISTIGKLFGVVTKLLIPGFTVIGDVLSWFADGLENANEMLDGWIKTFGFKKDENGEVGAGAKTASTIAALTFSGIFIKMFTNALKGKGMFSGITSAIKTVFTKGGLRGLATNTINNVGGSRIGRLGGKLGRLGGRLGRGALNGARGFLGRSPSLLSSLGRGSSALRLGGALKGGLGGIAGELIGSAIGGEGGNTISNVASFAGTGAMIGSFIPVIGTAVGGIIGGVSGLIYDSWDGISNVWNDESKTTLQKIGGSMQVIGGKLEQVGTDVANKISEWFTDIIDINKKAWAEVNEAWSGIANIWNDDKLNIFEKIVNMSLYGVAKTKELNDYLGNKIKSAFGFENDNKIENAVKEGTKSGMLEVQNKSKNFSYQEVADQRKKELSIIMDGRKKYIDEGQESAERASKLEQKQAKQAININVKTSIYGNELKTGMY